MMQKKIKFSLLFVLLSLTVYAQNQRVLYIDVGGNDAPVNWNNAAFNLVGNSILLHDSDSVSTGIRSVVDVAFFGRNSLGESNLTGDAAEFAPAGKNALYSDYRNDSYSQITFSKLNPDVAYSFTFFGSRSSTSDDRQARYTLTGSNESYADLNAAGNASNVAIVNDIYPRTDGTITLRCERSPDNTTVYYYLSAMKISFVEPPPEVIYVDAAGSSTATGWNLMAVNAINDVLLYTTNNVSSGIRAQVTDVLNGYVETSAMTPLTGAASEFTPAGLEACWGNSSSGELKFFYLNPNLPYNFTFFASRAIDAVGVRATTYTATGANVVSATLDAGVNDSDVAVVAGVLPNEYGTITVNLTRPVGSSYIFLNAFKLTFVDTGLPEPELPPISGKRLLFFGNQYTGTEDVPSIVANLAEAGGYQRPLIVSEIIDDGSLPHHIARLDNYSGFNIDHVLLYGTNKWDDVIFQPHGDEGASTIYSVTNFRDDALTLSQKIRNHQSGKGSDAQIVVFQTWARAAGSSAYPTYYASPDAMQDDVSANIALAVNDIESELGLGSVITAPVGEAFRRSEFDADLLYQDFSTPGNAGPELAALTLYRTIYQVQARDLLQSYTELYTNNIIDMKESDWIKIAHFADGLEAPEPQKPGLMDRETILIDPAPNTLSVPKYQAWNYCAFNIENHSLQLALTNGYLSPYTCEVVTPMTGVNLDGFDQPEGDAAIFSSIGANSAYCSVNQFQQLYYSDFGEVRFTGLAMDKSYSFTFYSGRTGTTENRETLFIVEGSNSGSGAVNSMGNLSEVVYIPDIKPKLDGTITLKVTAGPNNENEYKFYYVNAIKIESRGGGTIMFIL